MDHNNNQDDETKEEFADSRIVKTIRSLRKHSAKKSTQSSKSVKDQNGTAKEGQRDFKITKKKSSTNKSRIQVC